jgi:hypothetical protein
LEIFHSSGNEAANFFPAFIDGEFGGKKEFEGIGWVGEDALVKGLVGFFEFGFEKIGSDGGCGKRRENMDVGFGFLFAPEPVVKGDREAEGVGTFLQKEKGPGSDDDGVAGASEGALRKHPDEGAGAFEEPEGVAEGGESFTDPFEVDGESADPGEEAVVLELFFFHHTIAGVIRGGAGEEEDEEAVPPIGVVGDSKG